jgi:hypothetical protein
MAYFLKLLGRPRKLLSEVWWDERPELQTGVYFSKRPRRIRPGDRLIYYVIGGGKRVVAEAEVTGEATQVAAYPADWSPERRARFSWWMPVRLLAKCRADTAAPLAAVHYPVRIAGGSYHRLSDAQGKGLADAIRNAATRGAANT